MSYTRAPLSLGACCSGCAGGMGDALPPAVDTTVHPGESVYDYMARIGREMKTAAVDAQYVAQQKAAATAAVAFPGNTVPPPPVAPPISTTTKMLVVGGAALALFMLTRRK